MKNKKIAVLVIVALLTAFAGYFLVKDSSDLTQGNIGIKTKSVSNEEISKVITSSLIKADPSILSTRKDILSIKPSVIFTESKYDFSCEDYLKTMYESPDALKLLENVRTGKIQGNEGTGWMLSALDQCEPNYFEKFKPLSELNAKCNKFYYELGQGGLTDSERDNLIAAASNVECPNKISWSSDCNEIRAQYELDSNEIERGMVAHALAKNNCSDCADDFAQVYYNFGSYSDRSARAVNMANIDANAQCSTSGVVPEDATCIELEEGLAAYEAYGISAEDKGKYYYALLKKGCRPFDT